MIPIEFIQFFCSHITVVLYDLNHLYFVRYKRHEVNILLCLKKESQISFFGNSMKIRLIMGLKVLTKVRLEKEIGIIDVQMDNLIDELTSEGYIKKIG